MRFLTAENIELLGTGFACGLVLAAASAIAGRVRRWSFRVLWIQVLVAVVAACIITNRSDRPTQWDLTAAIAVLIIALAALGAGRASASNDSRWVEAALAVSCIAVWAGVPENGPAVLVGGVVAGTAVGRGRQDLSPSGAAMLTLACGWAALSGAQGRPWAVLGGALTLGVLPGVALPRSPNLPRIPVVVGLLGHVVIAWAAARWIGVDPHAGWGRVVLILGTSLVVGMATRQPSWRER